MHARFRTFTAAALAMIGGAVFCSPGTQAAALAPPDEIHATLDAYVLAHPHAVVVAGVIDGAGTATYAAGAKGAAVPPDRLRFQIGSVTKTFTATLLAQMVDAHEVALDDPIQRYLPAGVRAPEFEGKAITLRTIAEQTSGLPRLATNMPFHDRANPYADYTVSMLYDFLSHYTLPRAPGATYEYSNYAYTLLGQLLANRAHTTYAELVRKRIFDPLGMSDTVVTGSAASRTQLVPGYTAAGQPQGPWDFGDLGGAGSIESDMHDMLIYVRAYLAAPHGTLGSAMALAQRPRVPTTVVPGGIVQIGLAWTTNVRSEITFHNGETGGYYAYVAFDRTAQRAIVMLGNVADPTIEVAALHIFVPAMVPAPAYPAAQTHS